MGTLFSASNFIIVSSTVDFSGAPVTNGTVYECPANKYCDFYIRNLRAIGNSVGVNSIHGYFPDGIGGFVASDNVLASIALLSVSTNNSAGLHTLTSDAITNTNTSYVSPNDLEQRITPLGSVTVGAGDDRTIWGVRHGPVRLLAGDRIAFTGSFNAGGTLRVVYKAIEYSST